MNDSSSNLLFSDVCPTLKLRHSADYYLVVKYYEFNIYKKFADSESAGPI